MRSKYNFLLYYNLFVYSTKVVQLKFQQHKWDHNPLVHLKNIKRKFQKTGLETKTFMLY